VLTFCIYPWHHLAKQIGKDDDSTIRPHASLKPPLSQEVTSNRPTILQKNLAKEPYPHRRRRRRQNKPYPRAKEPRKRAPQKRPIHTHSTQTEPYSAAHCAYLASLTRCAGFTTSHALATSSAVTGPVQGRQSRVRVRQNLGRAWRGRTCLGCRVTPACALVDLYVCVTHLRRQKTIHISEPYMKSTLPSAVVGHRMKTRGYRLYVRMATYKSACLIWGDTDRA